LLGGDGQGKGRPSAALRPVFGPDPPALRLDQTLGDRQAETCTGGAARVGAPEAFEDPALAASLDPAAGVLNGDLDCAVERADVDGDCPVCWGVVQRVSEQVQEDTLDLVGSAAHSR
jgi:hypothetical protein